MMNTDASVHPASQPMDWVGDWVGVRSQQTPDRVAVIDSASQQQFSYWQLNQRAESLSAWMQTTAGLRAGDVVVLMSENRVEAIDTFLACGKAALVLAPVSHRLAPAEAGALIDRLEPQLILADSALESFIAQLPGVAAKTRTTYLNALPLQLRASADADLAAGKQRALSMDTSCLLVHTGGSTGLPKICQVSYRQMLWNAFELMAAAVDGLGQRRELVLFPLFHIGGWNTVIPILLAGGCLILQPRFDAGQALSLIDEHQINHFGAVEAMLVALSAHPDFASTSLKTLTGITTAGAPCSAVNTQAFFDRGIPVSQAYGLTEAGPSNFMNIREGRDIAALQQSQSCIGGPLAFCDYRILDPSSGEICAQGKPGELQLRSPHAFDGYQNDAPASAAVLSPGGWVRSGDLAVEEGNGQVRIIGRLDDMIVSGGENIAPAEIEAVLCEHPSVQAALVFGIPDTRWGQRPVAWVVGPSAQDTDPILTWLSSRIARFKRPVEVTAVDSLPLSGAGKLDRPAAKRIHQQDRGADT